MAENLTVARPYAEAAFRIAVSTATVDSWAASLERAVIAVSDVKVAASLVEPKRSAEQRAELIINVAGDLSSDQASFVRILARNGRLALLPEIARLFEMLRNEHQGIREAVVVSAFPIDQGALDQIIRDIEPRFGCKLKARLEVDPELIGGVRIAVGDQVIDASVRGKLAAMAHVLMH
ncbi:MAG: hypothetical protein AMXMBFR6_03480 [Betaproteobacteria bacterium]|jgi:F-type H+-transporting ATPase subunit delta|nr:F0F1 ATP synthase subunit delta [Rhodocyclaceae bacterium]MCG3185784.1 ATP synthase subunit delta [Rhodocyclaceae bacterium]